MSLRRQSSKSLKITKFDLRNTNDLDKDCKIIFVTMFENLSSRIKSKQDLNKALLLSRRNLTKRKIEELWNSSSKDLDLQEFRYLCEELKVTTENDILKAFQRIDINREGFINYEELFRILSKFGDKITKKEFNDFLETFDANKDNKLNYKEFVAMMMKTQEESHRAAERKYEKFMRDSKRKSSVSTNDDVIYGSDINSGSDDDDDLRSDDDDGATISKFTQIEGEIWKRQGKLPILHKPKNLKDWNSYKLFGSFYFHESEDDGIIIKTQHFKMEVECDTLMWISIEPMYSKDTDLNKSVEESNSHMDVMLFVLNNRGRLVACTCEKGDKGKSCLSTELKKGIYHLISYTSGSKVPSPRSKFKNKRSNTQLITQMGESYLITSAFRDVLSDIFKSFDMSGRGLLRKKDFELYTKLTCGDEEILQDEDWLIVLERVHTSEGLMSEQGFIELHELDAMDSYGDDTEFWDTLLKLGYDGRLHLTKASKYSIEIHSNLCHLKLDVNEISTFDEDLKQPIIDVVSLKGENRRSRFNKDVVIHTFVTEADALLVIENQSSRVVTVTVDCTKSENMTSHRGTLNYTSKVSNKSSMLFHHLLPIKDNHRWAFQMNEKVRQ